MILISPTEALFMPDDPKELREEWEAEMRSKGFQVWDSYAPVCTRIRMVPADLAEQIASQRTRIKELEQELNQSATVPGPIQDGELA